MECTITIKWWHDGSDIIDERHVRELQLNALERILSQRDEGYIAGELICEVEDITYNGWWEFKEVSR